MVEKIQPNEKQACPEMKVIQMPGRDEMIGKLREDGLYGMNLLNDKVYSRFVNSVAGSEKVGPDLALAWLFSIHNELKDYPPLVPAMMSVYFEPVIDTVVEDQEVANQAKVFMRETNKQFIKKLEKL